MSTPASRYPQKVRTFDTTTGLNLMRPPLLPVSGAISTGKTARTRSLVSELAGVVLTQVQLVRVSLARFAGRSLNAK